MSVGTYISGAGHAALLVWMVAGWGMQAEPLPFEITEVSVVSGDDFAAMTQGVQPELPPSEPTEIEQPAVEDTPPAPVVETPPEVPDAPAQVEPPAPETPPEAPDLTVPETVVTDTPPDVPDTPTIVAPPPSAELGSSLRPVPRPANRVAPEIITPPEPDATVAPEVATAASDQVDAPVEDTTEPAEETTSPEEAADQIVTEAEVPAFAPEVSQRPQTRPNRPAAVAETPSEDAVDPLLVALEEAGADNTEPSPSTPDTTGLGGGDISEGQKADLRREIRNCWSVGSASTAALSTLITVEWIMNPNGTIDGGSFDLVGFEGGSQADASVAFRIARSAIARCQTDGGRSGYSLPDEQFSQPRRVRLTFDPSEMRLR